MSKRITVERVHYSVDVFGDLAVRCDDKACMQDHVFGLYEYTDVGHLGEEAEWIADFATWKIANRARWAWYQGNAEYIIVNKLEDK
jgi:hypothetical protein